MPAGHHGVAHLYRRHLAFGIRPSDVLRRRIGNSPIPYFPFPDKSIHGLSHSLRFHGRVLFVLVVEVDGFHSHPFQAVFQRAAKRGRGGVRDSLVIISPTDTAFGCYDDVISDGPEGFPYQLFIDGGGAVRILPHIDFRRIKKSISFFKGFMDAPNGSVLFQRHAVCMGKPHAAEAY